MHDAAVFRDSTLGAELYSGSMNFPTQGPLGLNCVLPYVIVTDDAFPLKPNIMKFGR